jgi:hypothetical protein
MTNRYAAAPDLPSDATTPFHEAIIKLAAFIGATRINEAGTTVSDFKAQYVDVLARAEEGSLEVITRHKRRYVILEAKQVLALTKNAQVLPAAAELLADLPLMSVSDVAPPRSRAPGADLVRLGRLPG